MTVTRYRHPENWTERDIYRNKLIALPTYYVGQCVIDDGPDAVESFVKAMVETTMADQTLQRIASLLWSHTGGRAITTNGGGPGSCDYIELLMGKYTESDDRPEIPTEGYRWGMEIGWDEVSDDEDPDYYVRLTFGAKVADEDGCNPYHLWDYEKFDFGTDPTDDDVLRACEAIAKYVNTYSIPPHESPWKD